MENVNTLDYLLQVEAKASSLVNDAQDEADRRIRDNEEKCRAAFDERLRHEVQTQEALLKNHHEKVKNDYKNELDKFKQELLDLNVNKEQFCSLINNYLDNGG